MQDDVHRQCTPAIPSSYPRDALAGLEGTTLAGGPSYFMTGFLSAVSAARAACRSNMGILLTQEAVGLHSGQWENVRVSRSLIPGGGGGGGDLIPCF
jgi:hypothetical protein